MAVLARKFDLMDITHTKGKRIDEEYFTLFFQEFNNFNVVLFTQI